MKTLILLLLCCLLAYGSAEAGPTRIGARGIAYNSSLTGDGSGLLGINLSNTNTWEAPQTFNAGVVIGTGQTVRVVDAVVGTVFFAITDGHVDGDATKLFWDNAAKRLGIGLNNPDTPLHVSGKIKSNLLMIVPQANPPASPATGDVYVDSDDGSFYVYNGTAWATAAGDITEVVAGSGMTGGGASGSVTLNVVGDATLTVGADTMGINLGNANTWTAPQMFGAGLVLPDGQGITLSAGADEILFTGVANGGWLNDSRLLVGKASAGRGGSIQLLNDAGSIQWLAGIFPSEGATNYMIRSDPNGYNIVQIEASAPTNSLWIKSGGRILMGTATDDGTNRLQVSGDVKITGTTLTMIGANTNATNFVVENTSGSGRSWAIPVWGSAQGSRAGRLSLYDQTGGAARIEITTSGNVLIGTISDDGVSKLQVNGTATATALSIGADAFPISETYFGYTGQAYKVLRIGTVAAQRSIALCVDPALITADNFSGSGQILVGNAGILAPDAAGTAWMGVLRATGGKVYLGGGLATGDLNGTGLVVNADGTISAPGITNTALTAGRLIFSGTGGVQDDDAGLTWDDTNKRLASDRAVFGGGAANSDANMLVQASSSGTVKYFMANRYGSDYGALFGWDLGYGGSVVRSVNATDDVSLMVNNTTRALVVKPGGNVLIGTTTDDGVHKLQVNGRIASYGARIEPVFDKGPIYFSSQAYFEAGNWGENVLGGTVPTYSQSNTTTIPFSKVAYQNGTACDFYSDYIPVQPGETLYGEVWAMREIGATGTAGLLYYGTARYDKDKLPIAENAGIVYNFASGETVPANGTWTKYSGTVAMPTSHASYNGSDAGPVRYVKIYFAVNYNAGTVPTYWGGLLLRRQNAVTRDTGAVGIPGVLTLGGVTTLFPDGADNSLSVRQDGPFRIQNAAGTTTHLLVNTDSELHIGGAADAGGYKLQVAGNAVFGSGAASHIEVKIRGGVNANQAPVLSFFRAGVREGFISMGGAGDAPAGSMLIGNTTGLADYMDATLFAAANLAIGVSGNVSIGAVTDDTGSRLQVFGGNGGLPATSGTVPTAVLALRNNSSVSSLYFGTDLNSPYPSWVQAAARDALGSYFPFAINPRGGDVLINTASDAGTYALQVAGDIYSTGGLVTGSAGDPATNGIKINSNTVTGATYKVRANQNGTSYTMLSSRQTRTKEFTGPTNWTPTTIRDPAQTRNLQAQVRMAESVDSTSTYSFQIPDDLDPNVAPTFKFMLSGGTSTEGDAAMRVTYWVYPNAATPTTVRDISATTTINNANQFFYKSATLTAADFATSPGTVFVQVARLASTLSGTDNYTNFVELFSVSLSYTVKE